MTNVQSSLTLLHDTFLMLQKLIFAATTAAFLTTATIDKLAMDTSMAKQ